MQIVALGKPLFENRQTLPEAVEFSYQAGDYLLLISFGNLREAEIAAVAGEPAEFGLYCENEIIFLLYRFGDALPWSDAAYSWWNTAEEDRRLPPARENAEERALLKIILAESSTGTVKAIRVMTFSPGFTEKLHDAIRAQAIGDKLTRSEFVARALGVYEKFTPAELAACAVVCTKGGE